MMRPGVVEAPLAAPTGAVLVICKRGAAAVAGAASSVGSDR